MGLGKHLHKGLRVLLHRKTADQELDEETQHFFEEFATQKQEEGLSVEEAKRAARLQFGNELTIREKVRDHGWENVLLNTSTNLRTAIRRLRHHPGFAVAAMITLALGIGATTGLFGLIYGVLLRPLPYPQANRIVALVHTAPGINVKDLPMPASLYFTYREESRVFEKLALWNWKRATVTGL